MKFRPQNHWKFYFSRRVCYCFNSIEDERIVPAYP